MWADRLPSLAVDRWYAILIPLLYAAKYAVPVFSLGDGNLALSGLEGGEGRCSLGREVHRSVPRAQQGKNHLSVPRRGVYFTTF